MTPSSKWRQSNSGGAACHQVDLQLRAICSSRTDSINLRSCGVLGKCSLYSWPSSYLQYPRYPGISGFRYLSYRQNQVISKAIPTIPTHTPVFQDFNTYRQSQVFSKAKPTIPTIPWYFGISIPTVPARSGIFRYNTYDAPVFRDFDTYRIGKIGHFPVSYTHLTLPTIYSV